MYYYELCNKMQVNVMGVFMKSCFTLFVFYAMLMDNDLGCAASTRRPPGQGPVWRFLLMTLRIIGLEASQ